MNLVFQFIIDLFAVSIGVGVSNFVHEYFSEEVEVGFTFVATVAFCLLIILNK